MTEGIITLSHAELDRVSVIRSIILAVGGDEGVRSGGYRNFPSENAVAVVASRFIAFSLREKCNGTTASPLWQAQVAKYLLVQGIPGAPSGAMPCQVSGFSECLYMIFDGIPIPASRCGCRGHCQPPPFTRDF